VNCNLFPRYSWMQLDRGFNATFLCCWFWFHWFRLTSFSASCCLLVWLALVHLWLTALRVLRLKFVRHYWDFQKRQFNCKLKKTIVFFFITKYITSYVSLLMWFWDLWWKFLFRTDFANSYFCCYGFHKI